jgi:hypothetical protein
MGQQRLLSAICFRAKGAVIRLPPLLIFNA